MQKENKPITKIIKKKQNLKNAATLTDFRRLFSKIRI